MKSLFTLFTALFIGLFSQLPAYATWAHAQGFASPSGTNSSSISVTGVTVGHLLIVTTDSYQSNPTAASDGHNTYTLDVSNTLENCRTAVFHTVVTTGGSLTISITGTAFNAITVDEYSFTPGTISVSNTNNAGGNNTAPSAGNVTFTAPIALAFLAHGCDSVNTYTINASFAQRSSVAYSSAHNMTIVTGDILNASSSPVGTTGSLSNNTEWAMCAATYQSSGDSGTTSYGGVFSGSPLLPQM